MEKDSTSFPPFTVTRAAIEQIVALGGALRVDAEPGGCCGTAYAFAQVDAAEPLQRGDTRCGCPGAWLVVGSSIAPVLDGATFDYRAKLEPPRFRVLSNPNTESVCAWRRSFRRPWPGPRQPECRSYLPMPWDSTFDPPIQWMRQTGFGRECGESGE